MRNRKFSRKFNCFTFLFVSLCILIAVLFSATKIKLPQRSLENKQPASAPARASYSPPGIPNVSPADFKVNLEDRNFTCDPVTQADIEDVIWYQWTCSRADGDIDYTVILQSRTLNTLDSVNATIIQMDPSDIVSAEFLGYIATGAFIDLTAQQSQAKDWVVQTLPKLTSGVVSTIISDIPLRLYGPATARTLEIGRE